jgi:CRISPR-associated protein Csx10
VLDNNFKVKLKMESDWQIGTGAGIPGSVDELVSKDVDDFPQVPAKSLVGIWRDALERLTLGLDSGNHKGEWSNLVEVIFGNQPNEKGADPAKKPIPAILLVQPARLPQNLRAKIGNDKRLKQALTFVKVGVKIDGQSGTSETDMLRFEEMGRIGTVLEADVECERMNEAISALLILSAKLVERIGGKRRRGAGKCKLEIVGITDEDVKHAVETIRNKTTSTDKSLAKGKDTFTQNALDWQACEYTLTLETPVSIVTAVLGNVSETLDFIPGTYLISHFVKHFGQAIFKEIQANNFQISPATICVDGNRSFPVPKVFAQEKMNKENVHNRLLETLDGKDQTKPIREGFYFEKDDKVFHVTTPQTILMHNAVDDAFQRPTTDVVGVYSREAIKAGMVLKGEIRFRNLQLDLTASSGKARLDGKVRIGTSKKDDYGLARIELGTPKPFQAKSETNSKRLIVYLASDVMLRNGNLRQTNLVEDLATELSKTLNAKLTEAKAENGLLSSIIQVRRIESWQTSWGFPRPTLTLMQAGSVVVFEVQGNETEGADFESKLKELEKNGIGERRGEGYGQIIFNLPILGIQKPAWEKWEKEGGANANDSNAKTELKDEVFPKLIEETAWREELKLAVSKIAANENLRRDIFGFEIKRNEKGEVIKSTPAMSQIGGLRSGVMRLQEFRDKTLVINWLNHLKDTDNRIEKWDTGKNVRAAKLLVDNKLIPVFGTLEKVWLILCETEIDGARVWHSPKTLVQTKEHLQDKLWAEAVKSLFYACQHAHKRDSEKTGKGEKTNGAQN